MNNVFLDTNIVSASFKNDLMVLEALKNTSAIFCQLLLLANYIMVHLILKYL